MVFRVDKTKNYTVMSNYHLKDLNISLKAKGLLSFMLSLPENWDFSLNGLCKLCKEQKTSIKSTLDELKEYGYLVMEKDRNEKGLFEYVYNIYEMPISLEKNKIKPDIENPPMDNPTKDYQPQINTNKQNTKQEIDKDDKTKLFNLEEYNPLTIDLINRKFLSIDDLQIFYYDNLFNSLLTEYAYQDIIKICHYIIPRVIERDFCDEFGNKIENKFGYFKNSILNNIEKLKNNEIIWDEETGWFKDVEDNNIFMEDEYDDIEK